MSSERRLHPLSIVFESGRVLRGLLLPLVVLLFATADSRGDAMFVLTAIAGTSALVGVGGLIRYLRFTYRYDERDLVIRSGLLTRKERRIPYVRIQNLDAAQNPLHRLLGVAGVYVQTGGGAEPEASLSVLPLSALDEMRARVMAAGGRAGGLRATAGDCTAGESTAGDLTAGDSTAGDSTAGDLLRVRTSGENFG